MKYRITVTGWLPENQYAYGGTPEFIETYFIEARSADVAKLEAMSRFSSTPRFKGCEFIEAMEGM